MNPSVLNPDIFRERLRELYLRHHGLVWRACSRYVQNRYDADDLAHDVLLKAALYEERFAGECTLTSWLHRIAANHCTDHLRKRARHRERLSRHAETCEEASSSIPMHDEPGSPLVTLFEGLCERMGNPDRHLAYLRFEVGMTQSDISRITGISRAVVSKRLARIRERTAQLCLEHAQRERADWLRRSPVVRPGDGVRRREE